MLGFKSLLSSVWYLANTYITAWQACPNMSLLKSPGECAIQFGSQVDLAYSLTEDLTNNLAHTSQTPSQLSDSACYVYLQETTKVIRVLTEDEKKDIRKWIVSELS